MDLAVVVAPRPDDDEASVDENAARNDQHDEAALLLEDGTYVVVDLGSTNGTMVNGLKIAGEHRLAEGDIISIGSTHVRFEAT